MTSIGNSTINSLGHVPIGTEMTTGRKIGLESIGFLVAEGVSMLTGLGVVAVADQVIPKPMLDSVTKTVGKVVIEPFLDPIEHAMGKFCKLDECKVDEDKPRAERAENIAKTAIVFSAAWAASMALKLATRRLMNDHVLGLKEDKPKLKPNATFWDKAAFNLVPLGPGYSPHERMVFAADEGVHYGSMFLMNNQMAPFTDDMIRSTTRMLQKVTGWDETKAHEVSSMMWIWEAPNLLGALSGFGAIAASHAWGWPHKGPLKGWLGKVPAEQAAASHTEKLAMQTALGNTLTPSHG